MSFCMRRYAALVIYEQPRFVLSLFFACAQLLLRAMLLPRGAAIDYFSLRCCRYYC